MSRRFAVIVAALLGLIAVVLTISTGGRTAYAGGHTAHPGAHPGGQRSAPHLPQLHSARQYAAHLAALPDSGDATLSVPLPDGRVAWIFADTLVPKKLMHSTVIIQIGDRFVPTHRQLLPNDHDGTYWWPTAATALPGGRVLVTAVAGYTHRIRAAWLAEVGGVLRFRGWLPYWPASTGGVTWDAGLLRDGSMLRVYGVRNTGGYLVFGKELWLASVPVAWLGTRHGWSIGSAPVWGASPHGVDSAVAAYKDARGYHLVTLQDGVYGDGPVIRLDAPTPAGPFRVTPLLTYRGHPGEVRYNVAIHPEAPVGKGKLLLTINNNWPLDDHVLHALRTYKPSWFVVPA